MRILWNDQEKTFQAEFGQQNWASDQQAVKKAGFYTTGPPQWLWYCQKIKSLLQLKEKPPASGITITPEALQHFLKLKEQYDKNQIVVQQLKEAKKKLKIDQKIQKENALVPEDQLEHGEFTYFKVEPVDDIIQIRPTFPLPNERCVSCGCPVYMYELQNPPTCLDCEFF